jgi:hypothetical protein
MIERASLAYATLRSRMLSDFQRLGGPNALMQAEELLDCNIIALVSE